MKELARKQPKKTKPVQKEIEVFYNTKHPIKADTCYRVRDNESKLLEIETGDTVFLRKCITKDFIKNGDYILITDYKKTILCGYEMLEKYKNKEFSSINDLQFFKIVGYQHIFE